jgi:hypothetical protein
MRVMNVRAETVRDLWPRHLTSQPRLEQMKSPSTDSTEIRNHWEGKRVLGNLRSEWRCGDVERYSHGCIRVLEEGLQRIGEMNLLTLNHSLADNSPIHSINTDETSDFIVVILVS